MKKLKKGAFMLLIVVILPIYMYLWSWAFESGYQLERQVVAQTLADSAALSGITYFKNTEYTLCAAAPSTCVATLNTSSGSKTRALAIFQAGRPNPMTSGTPTITFTQTTIDANNTRMTLDINLTLPALSMSALKNATATIKSRAEVIVTTS